LRARLGIFPILLIVMAILVSPAVKAQKPCPLAPIPPIKPGANMFNAQQEMDLGEVMAEQIQRQYNVIDDPAVTAYLQRVGDRLVHHVTSETMKYQFVLYDQAVANAFGTTGGRIYVSRKLVGFMRNEDELAGLLGHEIGHMVAHQEAMEITELFQKLIGVNSVTDQRDIYDKYLEFVDNARRKPEVYEGIARREEPNQLIADHLGLFSVSASGYDPRALLQFWDRFTEIKGKTGGFFSDLFGSTKPEERRLREMGNEVAELPGPCGDPRPANSVSDFTAWKNAVMNYTGVGHREALHGVILKQELNPPLRGDIRFLRFSPDGKHVIAQDDSSVYVLTREPFAVVFRIDAPEAYSATFSADSKTISFYTPGLRVETWNVQGQQRTDLHDMVIFHGCWQTELSPDGKYLACFERETMDMRILDVSSGEPVFEKKEFYRPLNLEDIIAFYFIENDNSEDMHRRRITMRFSPDSHYFLAGSHEDTSLAVDIPGRKVVQLPGSIKKLLNKEFVFLGPDRLVGIGGGTTNNTAVVKFPSGDPIQEVTLGLQNVEAPAHGNFLLLRPIEKYPLGVMDLETKKIFMADPDSAFDLYDSVALIAHANGEIALKQMTTKQETAKLLLPRGPLAPLRAIALSPDLKFLAVSERSRGGVWDLTTNERPFYVRGFTGAYFSPDGTLYADFPKFQETGRAVGRLNVPSHASSPAYKIEEKIARQEGALLLVTKPNRKDQSIREDVTLDVRDAATGKTIWTHVCPNEAPVVFVSPDSSRVALTWRFSNTAAKTEMKANPDIAQRIEGIKRDDRNYFVEVLDGQTGKVLGGIAVDTNKGSFVPQSIVAAGDRVVVADNENRILVYSILAGGQEPARAFGRAPQASVAAGVLAAMNEGGQISVFDLAKLQKLDTLQFGSRVAMFRFSDDGKRLFVLTVAQTAYVLDVAALAKSSTTTASGGP
jgi:WD40 repeat protein